jgi:hypothetical protein
MTQRQFVLVVVDRDTEEFTVEGPMGDDRPWNHAVVNAQKVGRNLRCFGMGDLAPDVAPAEWRSSHGGHRIAPGLTVGASDPTGEIVMQAKRGFGSSRAEMLGQPAGRDLYGLKKGGGEFPGKIGLNQSRPTKG